MAAEAQLLVQDYSSHSFFRAKLDIELNLDLVISSRGSRTFKLKCGLLGRKSSKVTSIQSTKESAAIKSGLQNKVNWLENLEMEDISKSLIMLVKLGFS